ncbi:GNAT family N-acetyltransferase [Noviherbaspirillum sp. UKPF54]|uniref:bifunctional acetate--CoA ligase family protein/GNAT family N-acetyltransferase n=1 Tax=Noviherbaspirillum sp. UKPF54 TaxID=2601898 RepID=UPI0011B110FD|nr:GNAT family N-acetyltransferase [Noviherbaspirillum sp. UKPF54]QDZ27990.1 GNAT family N-acetyltransferase [Noviherbaspirillum sp. UKPF54]
MSVRNLKSLFEPRSIAVIGASLRAHSVGATVLQNLVSGGFEGEIIPVNPKYDSLAGLKVYSSVARLPTVPDLAIICTPPSSVPEIIHDLGERGTRAAIVLTAGMGAIKDLRGRTMKDLMLAAAKPYLLRILGPNCVGLLVPKIGLNASFAHISALPGKIAFVSQSGAMVTGVLDWARSRGIGFSKFISLGDSADIDFGDVLDYLASDSDTQAILMYMEAASAARKFMSAARAAARAKPTLVIKAGRAPEGAKAAASHTGALAGADDVYDAAIRRAGMLRVYSTTDLFDAAETLAHARPMKGDRLAIMTNGGGPGVMATDALIAQQGRLASLSEQALAKLDEILPGTWSHGNPVDIIGDAPAQRYINTLRALLQEPEADATLFIHAPTAIVPSDEIAQAVAPVIKGAPRNVLACWLGGESVARARAIFSDAGIATYDTPEEAVRGFMQIAEYHRNQALLMEVPPSVTHAQPGEREEARAVVQRVLAAGRNMLSEPEAKQVLAAYGIPVVQTRSARSVEEAVQHAAEIGFPVALKIISADITHKSDVGGVVLDLADETSVAAAAVAMHRRLRELRPRAQLQGFSVQSMVRRPEARELIVGVTTDAVFGPVILFGQGGIAVEVTADHAVALPPLNMVLARDLIARTRISRLLAAYRNLEAADVDAVCRTLIQISDLVVDIPEIAELDINPLLADRNGVIALDARIRVVQARGSGVDRLAIRPYPGELEEQIEWQGAPLVLRPIRPEDGPQHVEFFAMLEPDDIRYRMFISMRQLSKSDLARFTQIDYDREMAFIATRAGEDGKAETLGVARVIADPDNISAEFAIIVRSDLKGKGLGALLLSKLIAYCRARGTHEIVGETISHNHGLLMLAKKFGFVTCPGGGSDTIGLRLRLRAEGSGDAS